MENGCYERVSRFAASLRRLGLDAPLSKAAAVIAGYSGGADSSLMLYLLREYLGNTGTIICAAHLNHMIRGDEAARDEKFCIDTCEKYGVRLFTSQRDIPAIASAEKRGTEECARRERYAFFDECRSELADELECDASDILIATAHNASDNFETVLFNLIRGSGSAGLAGIAPMRGAVVRPMLKYESDEIRAMCAELGIDYVTDSTNLCDDYTRNYIRHDIIPAAVSLNPRAADAALRLASTVRAENSYLEKCTADALGEYSGSASVPTALLRQLPDALLPRALTSMYRACRGEATDLSYVHIVSCAALIASAGGGVSCVPDRVRFVCGGDMSAFVRQDEADEPDDTTSDVIVNVPESGGKFDFGKYTVTIARNENNGGVSEKNIYKNLLKENMYRGNIYGNLFMRTRRDGDTLFYGGHTHRLKKLLCDRHIPVSERDRLPVICDGRGIICVPGLPVRDADNADTCGKSTLYITFCEKSSL